MVANGDDVTVFRGLCVNLTLAMAPGVQHRQPQRQTRKSRPRDDCNPTGGRGSAVRTLTTAPPHPSELAAGLSDADTHVRSKHQATCWLLRVLIPNQQLPPVRPLSREACFVRCPSCSYGILQTHLPCVRFYYNVRSRADIVQVLHFLNFV